MNGENDDVKDNDEKELEEEKPAEDASDESASILPKKDGA